MSCALIPDKSINKGLLHKTVQQPFLYHISFYAAAGLRKMAIARL